MMGASPRPLSFTIVGDWTLNAKNRRPDARERNPVRKFWGPAFTAKINRGDSLMSARF